MENNRIERLNLIAVKEMKILFHQSERNMCGVLVRLLDGERCACVVVLVANGTRLQCILRRGMCAQSPSQVESQVGKVFLVLVCLTKILLSPSCPKCWGSRWAP